MAAYWVKAAHSSYDMFYKYKYLIVNLVFSHLGFWNGNFILIAPFPGRCLLVPFYIFSVPALFHAEYGRYLIRKSNTYTVYMLLLARGFCAESNTQN